MTLESFVADRRTYDAVTWQFFVMGEAARHVSDEQRLRHPEISWRRIAGLRDVLAHGYWAVEDATLWDLVQTRVPELLKQLRHILD